MFTFSVCNIYLNVFDENKNFAFLNCKLIYIRIEIFLLLNIQIYENKNFFSIII